MRVFVLVVFIVGVAVFVLCRLVLVFVPFGKMQPDAHAYSDERGEREKSP